MNQLKPCPFCGKSDKVAIYTESMVKHGELLWIRYGVKCKRCCFGIPTYAKKAAAINKWNSRIAEDALTAEIERLKSVIAEIAAILAAGEEFPEDDVFTLCKDTIGEKQILDRYSKKLWERASKLDKDTDVLTKESEGKDE